MTIRSGVTNMILSFGLLLLCFHSYVESLKAWKYVRVVGGKSANITEFPYQLGMEDPQGHSFCGATIIDRFWAITAAHCVFGTSESRVLLRSGSGRRSSGGKLHKVEKIIVHPNFTYTTEDYDVSLIKVSTAFNYSDSVQNISLAHEAPSPGTPAVVSGFGRLAYHGRVPSQLQSVSVNILDREKCKRSYKSSTITPRMICAGVPQGGKDACVGDSGGPLVAENKLVGIVSWGYNCALKGFPGVYTDVSEVFSWVNSIIAE